jgi:hypothetical protein
MIMVTAVIDRAGATADHGAHADHGKSGNADGPNRKAEG